MLLHSLIVCRLIRYYDLYFRVHQLRFCRSCHVSLLYDLGLSSQDADTILRRSKSEGLSFFTKTLPKLGKEFDLSLSSGVLDLDSSFKRKSKSKIPHFMGSLFESVFTDSGSLRTGACPKAVRAIRQVCFLFYKLPLAHSWVDEAKVALSFRKNEADLRELPPYFLFNEGQRNKTHFKSSRDITVLQRASSLIGEIFSKFSSDCLMPSHSSGSVVNGHNSITKWKALKNSKSCWNLKGAFIAPLPSLYQSLDIYPTWNSTDYFTPAFQVEDRSEVIFVPKDSRGPRLICREPAAYQYLQQGFMKYATKTIENHPLTKGRVNFTSQLPNQEKSRIGSIDQSLSTLDLKDASDRNSLSLTKLLWSKSPEALAYLLSTRTTRCVLHGDILPLEKFAAMGSACCFPVMALNIWALLIAEISVVSNDSDPSHYINDVLVFGDDIIVPTKYAAAAVRVIEMAGFLVNRSKSFINSRFTESCGADWFDGFDVTPLRLKCLCLPTNEYLVKMVQAGRNATKRNLHALAESLYYVAESYLGVLPYGSDTCSYLARWSRPEDTHVFTLTTSSRSCRAWTIRPITRVTNETGYARLCRILPMMGREDLVLPTYGAYTVPRRFSLRKRLVALV